MTRIGWNYLKKVIQNGKGRIYHMALNLNITLCLWIAMNWENGLLKVKDSEGGNSKNDTVETHIYWVKETCMIMSMMNGRDDNIKTNKQTDNENMEFVFIFSSFSHQTHTTQFVFPIFSLLSCVSSFRE